MLTSALLAMFLSIQPVVQAPMEKPEVLDKRIEQLRKAKNWNALADAMEGLPLQMRLDRDYYWLEALEFSSRWERLLEACDAVDAKPRQNKAELNLFLGHFKGKALSELGRHAEALAWLRERGKLGDRSSYIEASNEAQVLGDWKALEEIAEILIGKYPTSGVYLGMKGQALAKQHRFEEAESALNEAVHLVPKNPMNWADLACCYNEDEKYQEACDAAEEALKLNPLLMEGLCNRGRAFIGLKRYRDGRNDFAAALALDPKDSAIVQNLKLNIAMADRFLANQEGRPSKQASRKR